MAEAAIISWTPSNWITILLMVAIGFFVVASVAKIVAQKKSQSSS
jgi:hypothetical protein